MSLNFQVWIETDDATGNVLAAYFQIRKGKSHETREFADGNAFADYNRRGELLGVELLAPCRVSIVNEIAAEEPIELRNRAKRFIRNSGPRELVPV